jgi:hypothetical protein
MNQNSHSHVLPDENWFYYWRTSASLWEGILDENPSLDEIWILVNWGGHFSTIDKIDFGEIRPELDFFRLALLCRKKNRNVKFFFPLGPFPTLENGGVPSLLSTEQEKTSQFLARTSLDCRSNVLHLFTFYDPKVHQLFKKFLWHFKNEAQKRNLSFPCYGIESFRYENNSLLSEWDDESTTFYDGLKRFLEMDQSILSQQKKKEFQKRIRELYLTTYQEQLGTFWEKVIPITFLGDGEAVFLERSLTSKKNKNYINQTMSSVVHSRIPSLALLREEEKSHLLENFLHIILDKNTKENFLGNVFEEDDPNRLLVFVNIYQEQVGTAEQLGLFQAIQSVWPYCYREKKLSNLDPLADVDSIQPLNVFLLETVTKEVFNQWLNLLLGGHWILVTKECFTDDLLKRWNLFIAENKLKTEKVNWLGMIEIASLSEGKLITIEKNALTQSSEIQLRDFWLKIFSAFSFRHLDVDADTGFIVFWKTRQASGDQDFKYQEIRRVYLFNPESVLLKATIPMNKKFAFLKVIDPQGSRIRSTPLGLEIEIESQGMVALDFGSYQE